MTTKDSLVNTNANLALVDNWQGAYDDSTGYFITRVWVTAPAACTLFIYYADDVNGANVNDPEIYTVQGNYAHAINSMIKKPFVRVELQNNTQNTQTSVVVRTKFSTRVGHPFLTYTNDDVTANVSIALDEIKFNQTINQSEASIQIYGTDGTANRAIITDINGRQEVKINVDAGTVGEPANGNMVALPAMSYYMNDLVPTAVSNASGLPVKFDNTGTGNTVKLDATNNTVKLDGTGNTVKLDATNNTVKLDATNNTVKLDATNNTVKFDNTGNTVKLDTGNNTVKFDNTGTGNTVKLDATNNTVKLDGTGNTVKLDATNNMVKFDITGTGNTVKLDANNNTVKLDAANNTVKMTPSALFYSNIGYNEGNGLGNLVRIGSGAVNAIYSINLFNTDNANTYYVKLYARDAAPLNMTIAEFQNDTDPIMNNIVSFAPRDLNFGKGVLVNKLFMYVLVSTQPGKAASADIANNPVHVNITYD